MGHGSDSAKAHDLYALSIAAASAQGKAKAQAQRFRALADPTRYLAMSVLDELGEASAAEVAEVMGEDAERVRYHFRVLAELGEIRLVDTDTRRGGAMKIYRTNRQPLVDMEEAASMSRSEREALTEIAVAAIISDLLMAQAAGTIDDDEQRTLLRLCGRLDQEGTLEMAHEQEAHLRRKQAILARSGRRLAKAGKEGALYSTASTAVPMPPLARPTKKF